MSNALIYFIREKAMSRNYPVNQGQEGTLDVNHEIQNKLTVLQEHVCSKHSKVLSVRFDVRYPQDYPASGDNKDISKMISKMNQAYKRMGYDPDYMWVREKMRSDNPHYHCVLFLNGSKTRKFNHVFKTAESLWGSTIGADVAGCIDHCTGNDKNGLLIVSKRDGSTDSHHDNFDAVHLQNSYLAKENGKGLPKDGLRNFGMSRIPNIKINSK